MQFTVGHYNLINPYICLHLVNLLISFHLLGLGVIYLKSNFEYVFIPGTISIVIPWYRSDINYVSILKIFITVYTGCNDASIYGSNCDTPCPTNCKVTCHIQSGTCFNCKPGWNGKYCNTSKTMNMILSHFKYLCFVMFQLSKTFW